MLTFVLPTHPEIELCPDGSKKIVTGENVDDYLQSLLYFYFDKATKYQVRALKLGFDEVFASENLQRCFFP